MVKQIYVTRREFSLLSHALCYGGLLQIVYSPLTIRRPLFSRRIMTESHIPQADLESFRKHLESSNRILALLGAGLSAPSGLPTFRGAGGLWRNHEAVSLATPKAFAAKPGLVWQFYSYRRHMALKAQPNRAHYALAELARKNPNFMTVSQNIDGDQRRHAINLEASLTISQA
jgi:hypothetical protein